MSILTNVARLTAAIGIAAAITVGVAAAPAQAAAPGTLNAVLTIQEVAGRDGCKVTIVGNVGMDPAQAQYLVDNGARARIELWGDDPIWDNRLVTLPNAQLSASSPQNGNGLIIVSVNRVNCFAVLNEDKAYHGEEDEIYARVIFDGPGYPRITKKTNTVSGTYW